jgi:hypothetical protein
MRWRNAISSRFLSGARFIDSTVGDELRAAFRSMSLLASATKSVIEEREGLHLDQVAWQQLSLAEGELRLVEEQLPLLRDAFDAAFTDPPAEHGA